MFLITKCSSIKCGQSRRVLIYCTSTYWKLYCTTACGFCCTHERIKFVFNITMFILSSICEHNMKQQWISVSGPLGYCGASVVKWIQTCEGKKVSSSSRVDMPKNTLKLADEDFALPQNVSIQMSTDAAPYPTRAEASGTLLQKSQNLYTLHLLKVTVHLPSNHIRSTRWL
jgi:hypothetical protein